MERGSGGVRDSNVWKGAVAVGTDGEVTDGKITRVPAEAFQLVSQRRYTPFLIVSCQG